MKMSIEERVKVLEKKVLKLEDGNIIKEEPRNAYESKSTTKEDKETTPR